MASAMIDLNSLAIEAGRTDGDCVVTRRWLRQVLKELRAARAPAAEQKAALDLALPKIGVTIEPLQHYEVRVAPPRRTTR